MEFAKKLMALIEMRGRTQGWVAKKADLAPSAVSGMTAGTRRPYMDQALALARALDVPLDWLADDLRDDLPTRESIAEERAALELFREMVDALGGPRALAEFAKFHAAKTIAVAQSPSEPSRTMEPLEGTTDTTANITRKLGGGKPRKRSSR